MNGPSSEPNSMEAGPANCPEADQNGATVLLQDGVTQFYRKVRDVEPAAVGRFRDIAITVRDFGFAVQAPSRAVIETMPRNKYTRGARSARITQNVLAGVNLQFKPGTVSLILGPPGSGRSSLLKALAGSLEGGTTSGEVLYNGLPVEDVDSLRTVALIDQTDHHIPVLTVRETLEFASACQSGCPPNTSPEEYTRIVQHNVDVTLRLLGLDSCADTIVGNAAIRGVSGGQRRRVTTAEILVSGVSVVLGDEISTGLDSSATLDIVRSLRSWARAMRGTVVLALLQPQPEVVGLFDQVVCLDQGQVVCAGTVAQVDAHFASLGFRRPPRKDFADFVQEVTGAAGVRFHVGVSPTGARVSPPADVAGFRACFESTALFKSAKASVDFAADRTAESAQRSADAVRILRRRGHQSKFANSFSRSLSLLLAREWALATRDRATLLSLFGEALLVGLLMGGIFFGLAGVTHYQTPRSGMGALFFCCAILQRQAWQQIPILMRARPTFYKQRRRDFFPTSAFIAAFSLVQIPFNVAAMALFCPIVYFMVGFEATAAGFAFFFLTLVLLQHALRALFLAVAAAARTASSAQFSCSILVVCFLLFSGYILTNNLIPPYWIWLYWVNPLAFGLRSLALNEYTSDKYSPAQSDFVLSTYGLAGQNTAGFLWAGPALLLGYLGAFTLAAWAILDRVRHDAIVARAAIEQQGTELESRQDGQVQCEGHDGVAPSDLDLEVAAAKLSPYGVPNQTFVPVTLAFKQVSYTVFPRKGPADGIKLLHCVSGAFRPGRMTALMGSSGAGKTTLMDVIAGRKTQGSIEGAIAINGHAAAPSDFSRISGYCEQMDIHSAEATVYEAFLFSAALRQPQSVPHADKVRFVEDVLELMELGALRDRLIGETPRDGLSVEQRKRVTIGVELSANPSVVFADEPTSGLDARAAMLVMRALRRVALADRTVVATIHQPSAAIFEMFDDLLLLQKGGHVIYNGPLGHESCMLLDYFGRAGAAPMAEGENPADYMLTAVGAGLGAAAAPAPAEHPHEDSSDAEAPTKSSMRDFAVIFQNSEQYGAIEHAVEAALLEAGERPAALDGARRATSQLFQLGWCVRKAFTTYYRSPQYNLKRLVTLVALALLFGTAYLGSGQMFPINNQSKARSFAALIYLCMDFVGILLFCAVLPITFRERTVYYRERSASMYSSGVYMAAMFLAELPYLVASVGLFAAIMYFMVGLPATWFGYFFLVFWLYVSLCTFLGQLFAIAAPHEIVGQVLVGLTTVVFNLASGYLVSREDMPVALQWVYWISPSSYAFNGLASTQLAYCPAPGADFAGCNWLEDKNMTLAEYAEQTFALRTDIIYSVDIPVLLGFWCLTLVLCGLSLKWINHDTR